MQTGLKAIGRWQVHKRSEKKGPKRESGVLPSFQETSKIHKHRALPFLLVAAVSVPEKAWKLDRLC